MSAPAAPARALTIDDLGDDPIRLVTFDLYDTLIELEPRRWQRLQSAMARSGIAADATALMWADLAGEDYYTVENGRLPIRDRSAEDQHAFRLEHLRRWAAAAGIALDAAQVEELYRVYRGEFDAHATGTAYRTCDDVMPALVRLREAGVRRAVISNADADVTDLCVRLAFAHEMDAIITSALVGWEKPDPRTFHAALDHPAVGIPAGAALHVGDQPKSDVVGSIAIGMRAALIDRYHRHTDGNGAVIVPSLITLADAVIRHNERVAAGS